MRGRRLVAVGLGAGALLLAAPGAAQAHPLGNFTVNHYDHLQLTTTTATLTSVVDRAEIPAAQALQTIAPDGTPSDEQLAAAATAECTDLRAAVQLRVDGDLVRWTAGDATMESVPGAAGLPTLRLTCTATADADLAGEATVELRDEHLPDRVGWREMTADGDGVRLVDSPVPTESITDELRQYPEDLLASPVDVRSFTVQTEPGTNTGSGASVSPTSGDPFTSAMLAVDRQLEEMIGDRELTPLVGTLAVLLAVLLGCGHALLPGHGKTVMAAYLAGRSGRPRDAVVVGATVTATHTVGVLGLGLALSLSSSLAGDQVIRWLGVVSGLLVAGIGLAMLRSALPRWRAARAARSAVPALQRQSALAGAVLAAPAHTHGAGHAPGHDHPHDDHPHDDHPHDDHPHGDHGHGDHQHPHGDHPHGDHGHTHGDHDHPHDHDGHTHDHDGHTHEGDDHEHGTDSWWSGGHSHGPGGHTHGPGGHTHGPGRSGLIGMGVAGGLVPSPSALIVLLASIGLGRTVFGVLLVLAYGIGMAGTLTAVGLLLVRLRGRLDRRVAGLRRDRVLARIARAMPVVTATLVLLVGVTLVARGVLLA